MCIVKLAQLKNAYRYNIDSLLLADFALKFGVENELLDIGAGNGIIGILLKKKLENLNLSLLDIQEENINLIKQNLKQNNIKAQIFHTDFLEFKSEKKFDFLVSNPPFYKEDILKSENSHKNISKFQDSLPLQEFISKANSIIKPKGVLYMCYKASFFDRICSIFESKKFKLTKICFVYTNKSKKARLVLIEAKKSSKSLCEILPPFFVYENENLSKEMQEIHSRFKLESYDI